MVAQVTGTLIHILWCYIFVNVLELHVQGLGLATAITNFGMFLLVTIYAHCIPQISDCLFFFDSISLQGWCEYLKLGVPTAILICAEFWAF